MSFEVILWLAAIVLFVFLEAATAGIVSLWFIGGSLVAFITALLHGSLTLQIILFFVVSIALLVLFRPLVKKLMAPGKARTNADRLLDREALVIESIDNLRETGAIRVGGVYWTAKSADGTPISEGTKVRIQRIEGAKVYVVPAEVPAEA